MSVSPEAQAELQLEAIAAAEDMRHDGAAPVVLTEAVQSLSRDHGVAPSLTAALRLEAIHVHATGDDAMDRDLRRSVAHDTFTLLEVFGVDLPKAIGGDFFAPQFKPGDSRAVRRLTQRDIRRGNAGNDDNRFEQEEHRRQVDEAVTGIAGGFVISPLIDTLRTNYYFELNLDQDPTAAARHASITELRARKPPDLTRETLDERVASLLKLAQLASTEIVVGDLAFLGDYSRSGSAQAVRFAKEHTEVLREDHYAGKIRMAESLAAVFGRLTPNTKNRLDREAPRLLASKYKNTARLMTQFATTWMQDAYVSLGYEYVAPVVLDDDPAPRKLIPVPLQPIKAQRSADGEQIVTAAEMSGELRSEIDGFASEWRLSTKQRKGAGLNDLEHGLVVGHRTADGQELHGVDKTSAEFLSSILFKLATKVAMTGANEAQKTVEGALATQRRLESDLATLVEIFRETGTVKKVGSLPTVPPIAEYITMLRDNWPVLSDLIKSRWPNGEGAPAALSLEKVLFGKEEATQERTPHLSAPLSGVVGIGEAIEVMQIAERLDEIILPPDATMEQIERELVRIKAENPTVTTLEWQRLRDLAQISERFGGVLYRSKPRSLGETEPYYVAAFEIDNSRYAVAESPVFGNATYVVGEDHVPGTWLEVLELSKRYARSVGAVRIIHSDTAPHGDAHVRKVLKQIDQFHARRP